MEHDPDWCNRPQSRRDPRREGQVHRPKAESVGDVLYKDPIGAGTVLEQTLQLAEGTRSEFSRQSMHPNAWIA